MIQRPPYDFQVNVFVSLTKQDKLIERKKRKIVYLVLTVKRNSKNINTTFLFL